FFLLFVFLSLVDLRVLPSFPTRRSSDLDPVLFVRRGLCAVHRHNRPHALCPCTNTDRGHGDDFGSAYFHIPDAEADLDAQTVRVDRKSTRLNSSHVSISYAVFCLKKKIK